MVEGASERAVLRDQCEFLCHLWRAPAKISPEMFGNLCFRRKGMAAMIDQFIVLGDKAKIKRLLWRYDRNSFDQYFSPNVYVRPSRKVDNVRVTSLGWCDIDEADPFNFNPRPSAVWETSPGRTQALWFWDRLHSATRASAYSKALTYRHDGDKGGSAPNKLLRLPGSFNHKPEYAGPFIPLLHYDPQLITIRPRLLTSQDSTHGAASPVLDMNPHAHDRLAVLKKYRFKLDLSTRHLIRHSRVEATDRSGRIFAMVAGLHKARATRDEIASVIWGSPYFRDKYGDDKNALKREISRIIAKVGGA